MEKTSMKETCMQFESPNGDTIVEDRLMDRRQSAKIREEDCRECKIVHLSATHPEINITRINPLKNNEYLNICHGL